MNDNYLPEQWKKIDFGETISEKEAYLISTHGRVKSLKIDKENGILSKLSSFAGYVRIPIVQKSGKRTARYVHKLVAQTFIEKRDESQKFVIHIDYDKQNNKLSNLQWANKEEKEAHLKKDPRFQDPVNRVKNSKLTEGRVRMIKRKLNDPNRKTRLKMLAKQFGVSEMQLHRIKTGENWGYVTID
jgi:hypothetical protein